MIPLAVSGLAVISVAVIGALLLLAILLRAEDRADAREEREERERDTPGGGDIHGVGSRRGGPGVDT